ncbi:hypothetical protein CC1G_04801 [Coprinopsis cinerea okayama7|uniref:Uncharacterized protein n=1 Tax=Coprinopsis cinerea (strain Okayama-7 / 130 / ATCC MYA-4618 / FGSC 9003) TaxID=240176 RepID=A8P2M0_COPC7|nr:hypothetical protein CC1G_04801 [Coprinopsis cinerea okayama7\|eukprot:XP_001838357.2 hypothetical protein CC1G_04801 [Coprinopsis cinerea okayama7\
MQFDYRILAASNLPPTESQIDEIKALLREESTKEESLELEIRRIQEELHRLRLATVAQKRRVSDYKAILSPIRSLPAEIIAHILLLCAEDRGGHHLPFPARYLVLGQICSRWRAIALATPDIWATIQIHVQSRSSVKKSIQVAHVFAERSQPRLLTLDVSCNHSHHQVSNFLPTLLNERVSSRIHSLRLRVPERFITGPGESPIRHPFPKLAHLDFCGLSRQFFHPTAYLVDPPIMMMENPFIAGSSLTTLKVEYPSPLHTPSCYFGLSLPDTSQSWSNITSIILGEGVLFETHQFFWILEKSAAKLERFVASEALFDASISTSLAAPIVLPHLHTFAVHLSEEDVSFINHLTMPALKSLSIAFQRDLPASPSDVLDRLRERSQFSLSTFKLINGCLWSIDKADVLEGLFGHFFPEVEVLELDSRALETSLIFQSLRLRSHEAPFRDAGEENLPKLRKLSIRLDREYDAGIISDFLLSRTICPCRDHHRQGGCPFAIFEEIQLLTTNTRYLERQLQRFTENEEYIASARAPIRIKCIEG